MRKIISLGLLAATILGFSTQLVAGYPQCDNDEGSLKADLQDRKLYGLCNAYWDNEGDPDTQAAIREKFLLRADGAYTEIPGVVSGMTCPCWAGVVLADIGNYTPPDICYLNTPSGDQIFFKDPDTGASQRYNTNGVNCVHMASYTDSSGPVSRDSSNTGMGSSDQEACLREIEDIENTYFSGGTAKCFDLSSN